MMDPPERPVAEADLPVSCKEFWSGFQQKISRAEYLLDHNMHIIVEINNNHCFKASASLPQNALLTKELSTNINKVVDLYASLSDLVERLFNDQNSVDSSEDDDSPQGVSTASGIKSTPSAIDTPLKSSILLVPLNLHLLLNREGN